jgi:hypothetical protein
VNALDPDEDSRTWEEYPPTQALMLEVLGARWRLGYERWPFSSRHRRAAAGLKDAGLVTFERGFEPRTINVKLTGAGLRAVLLPSHRPPAVKIIEGALFLLMNGERAPGGDETWSGWAREAELFLRRAL